MVAVAGSLAIIRPFRPLLRLRWTPHSDRARGLLYYRPKTRRFKGVTRFVVCEALTSPMHGSLTLSALQRGQPVTAMGLAMIRQAFKRLWNDKRGNAILIAGAAMPLVIGSAGLGVDTIQWALWKRQLQRAADSAAIAGVYARIATQDTAAAITTDLAKHNRTQIALLGAPVVTYPPATTQWNNSVAVALRLQKRLNFSSMFLSSPPIIAASATAAAVNSGCYSVVSLETTSTTGIAAGGNANVDLGACGMITNSTALEAAIAFGSSTVLASPIAAVGGLDRTDNWAAGSTLLPFTLAQPDPFASRPVPPIPSPCGGNYSDSPGNTTTLTAGCYRNMTFKGNTTLGPGTYILTGDFNANSSATITCNGCTIILTNSNPSNIGTLDLNGGATLNMTASKTGAYAGILFFQDRAAPSTLTNKINGGASSFFQGAMYFPGSSVEFSGNASIVYNCLKLVARRVTFTGSSDINNTCPSDSGVPQITGSHVRLVA
ncbi:MAG: pilus assembly protein TadG-related protein [Sphingomonas bacterium]|nr:pilus assembly protein TadG-related protein [Sphingomonas bacterium]